MSALQIIDDGGDPQTPAPAVDELYTAFVGTLPEALVEPALGLAVTLGLAPSQNVRWSEVFSHEVTLGAPILVAEAMPALSAALVRDATLAHLLAILEAFSTDRLHDGQVAPSPLLDALLSQVRRARDGALARVTGDGDGVASPYVHAESETLAAIAAEHELLWSGEPATFARYLTVSHGKQRVGLPASLALARAAGWSDRRTRCLARLLDAVWVGLQLHDDVVDWEDDLAHGGAWATSLAGHVLASAAGHAKTRPTSVKRLVHETGVLARMLVMSGRCFRGARRRAEVLGARRLAGWAGEREAIVVELARREAESPGFTNRAHALSAWAKTVLP